jgi:hypothetical protein
MITPISRTHASEPASQSTPKPDHQRPAPQQTVKSGTVSGDQVTLKNAGQVDSETK